MTHEHPSLWMASPFATLLGMVATFPLIPATAHWWERNRSKLVMSVATGLVVVVHYLARGWGYDGAEAGGPSALAMLRHAILGEYLPFLALLGSLYIIAGGVWLEGDVRATPLSNLGLLAVGAVGASLIGTTGAAMILIRPLLQTNAGRANVRHTVVFFIFIVANAGGCLLPVGDPPLFLGYLRGVPFLWTTRLFLPWLFVVTTLLAIYYAWERVAHRAEPDRPAVAPGSRVPVRVGGKGNFVWLGLAVLAVAAVVPGRRVLGTSIVPPPFAREFILAILAGLSLRTTPPGLRILTGFRYGPIVEVACLFLGIFVTMAPAMEILHARGPGLGLDAPVGFFWMTGGLSSLLDNAPTYLVFFEVAQTLPTRGGGEVILSGGGTIDESRLAAISLGAVFAGALTYIGNGPNLMVKAIAESRGVRMPGFLGFAGYGAAILLPVLVVASLLFLG